MNVPKILIVSETFPIHARSNTKGGKFRGTHISKISCATTLCHRFLLAVMISVISCSSLDILWMIRFPFGDHNTKSHQLKPVTPS